MGGQRSGKATLSGAAAASSAAGPKHERAGLVHLSHFICAR